MTPRELVKATLEFRNETGIVPRQLWVLPWAEKNYGKELERIRALYPDDFAGPPVILDKQPPGILMRWASMWMNGAVASPISMKE